MKTINLNRILFVTLCFLILTSCSAQKLIYEPLGEMDKPLPTIEIDVNQLQKSDNVKAFVLDTKTFNLLVNYTREQLGKSDNVKTEYEYGCYKVSYYVGSKKIDYILASKENSRNFFNGQKGIIISNQELYKELEVLLKRLK